MIHMKRVGSLFLQQTFNPTAGRYVIAILFVWGMLICTIGWNIAYATDCNSDCEGHFDQWYQKPDLGRCQAEREIACQTGLETCDLFKYQPTTIQITAILQETHNAKNDPHDEAECYGYIDNLSTASTIYEYAHKFALGYSPYGIAIKELTKQMLRCSCKAVNWKTGTTGSASSWVRTSTPPNSAIVGGSIVDTPKPVYICRAESNGNLHPGKVAFYNGRWSCFIGNGGKEQRYESFEIFAGNSSTFAWSGNITNQIPANAIVGGRIVDTPKPVYICRANHGGNLHPGKMAFYNGRWSCFIGNGGKEQRYETYQVLLKK